MEYVNLGLNFIIAASFVILVIVMNNRIKSLENLNKDMKSYLKIFKIDDFKKYAQLKEEKAIMGFEIAIHEQSKKFAQDNIGNIKILLKDELDKVVGNIEGKYNEVCEVVYDLILQLPEIDREEFMDKYLPLTKSEFLRQMKKDNYGPEP